MNKLVPLIVPAREAYAAVLGQPRDLREALGAFAMDEEEMVALYVDGDWTCGAIGPAEMEELFAGLAARVPSDKIVCAVVIKGSLDAAQAILIDRDTDWAPSLIVGGSLVAHSLCLGGGATRVMGDLVVHATIYGKYNHGSLEVGGNTRAETILSSDFRMHFGGQVSCPHVISAMGRLNIPVHFRGGDIGLILDPDFVDDNGQPIDDLILGAVNDGLPLLRADGAIGQPAQRKLSREGQARVKALHIQSRSAIVTRLNFANCSLKFVPDQLAAFTDATWLSLKDNLIGSLPDSLAALDKLETLDLSDCGLTIVPDWLAQLPRLRQLNLAGNNIETFPAAGFGALQELRLGKGSYQTDAHSFWLTELRLDSFPVLERFENTLKAESTLRVDAGYDAWYSPTLQHLRVGPALQGEMPECLASMPQLRSLDIQIGKGLAASALAVLGALPGLEAIRLSGEKPDAGFLRALGQALPSTMIRCCSDAEAAAADPLAPPRLRAGDELVLRERLDQLSRLASNSDANERARHLDVLGAFASDALARMASLSVATLWALDYRLGLLRVDCQLALARWLIRRELPDPAAAAALLDQASTDLAEYGAFHFPFHEQLRNLATLRALIA